MTAARRIRNTVWPTRLFSDPIGACTSVFRTFVTSNRVERVELDATEARPIVRKIAHPLNRCGPGTNRPRLLARRVRAAIPDSPTTARDRFVRCLFGEQVARSREGNRTKRRKTTTCSRTATGIMLLRSRAPVHGETETNIGRACYRPHALFRTEIVLWRGEMGENKGGKVKNRIGKQLNKRTKKKTPSETRWHGSTGRNIRPADRALLKIRATVLLQQ